jgi:hypothetical protein
MPVTIRSTHYRKTPPAHDLVADLTAGSALLVPLTARGERYLAHIKGQRVLGSVFCRRGLAELLLVRAVQEGIEVRVRSDSVVA